MNKNNGRRFFLELRCLWTSNFVPTAEGSRTDTGSVRLQDGPDTIPLYHQSNVYFWPEDQLSPQQSGPP